MSKKALVKKRSHHKAEAPEVKNFDTDVPKEPAPEDLEIELRLAQVRSDVAIYRPFDDTRPGAFSIAEVLVKREFLPDEMDYSKTIKVLIEI